MSWNSCFQLLVCWGLITLYHKYHYLSPLCSHGMSLQPSVLALAVIGCELKLMGSDWLAILMTLQDKAQVYTHTLLLSVTIVTTGWWCQLVSVLGTCHILLHHPDWRQMMMTLFIIFLYSITLRISSAVQMPLPKQFIRSDTMLLW